MEEQRRAIVLFSGGRDSLLTTCKLIEDGFRVYMVTFENDFMLNSSNAKHGANRIIKKYGYDKAEFLGIKNISAIFREFFPLYFNMKPKEISKEYGELTISQFNCLACRSSMYIYCIIKAKQMGIKYIAAGTRKSEGFVVQLPIMINKFKKFLKQYSLELLTPIYDLNSKWELKNSLLQRGFVPKTLEPQCLLGVPLKDNKEPDKEIQKAVGKFFDKIILKRSDKIIKRYLKIK